MEREVTFSWFSCLDSFTLFMCAANEFFIWKRRVLMACYLRNQNYLLIHGASRVLVNSMKNNIINDCHLFALRSSDDFIECQQFVNVMQRIAFARTKHKTMLMFDFPFKMCVFFVGLYIYEKYRQYLTIIISAQKRYHIQFCHAHTHTQTNIRLIWPMEFAYLWGKTFPSESTMWFNCQLATANFTILIIF